MPKIEVEDLSSPKPESKQNGQQITPVAPVSSSTSQLLKEPVKETLKVVESIKVEQKTTTSSSVATPSSQVTKKPPVKKVNRSSKSLKKVKKRQPP